MLLTPQIGNFTTKIFVNYVKSAPFHGTRLIQSFGFGLNTLSKTIIQTPPILFVHLAIQAKIQIFAPFLKDYSGAFTVAPFARALTVPPSINVLNVKQGPIPLSVALGNHLKTPRKTRQNHRTLQPTQTLPTPVRSLKYQAYLQGYPQPVFDLLIKGFTEGFRIHFTGTSSSRIPNNLLSAYEHPDIVQNKLNKELQENRLVGPFRSPPFAKFHVSPIGVVPKKAPGDFRLIHHLSYPRGNSVNDLSINQSVLSRMLRLTMPFVSLRGLGRAALCQKQISKALFEESQYTL